MTTTVIEPRRDQITELISHLDGGRLTEPEIEIFQRFVDASTSIWAAEFGGELLGVWGLVPPTLLSDQAYLWLHTTEAAKEHEFILVRQSQIQVKKMLETYPRIVGQCLIEETRSIRWLKWLGAEFGDHDGRFVPFLIERKG